MSELVRHLEAEKSARALFEELLVKTDVGARLSGLEYENQVLRQQLLDKSESEYGAGHWVLGAALCAAGLCALCMTHSGRFRSGAEEDTTATQVISKLLASAFSLTSKTSSPPDLLTVLEDLHTDVGQLKAQEQEVVLMKSEIRALQEQKELESLEQKLSRAVESQIQNLREELGHKLARSEAEALKVDFGGKFASLREEVVSANSEVKMFKDEQSREMKSLREAVESSKVQEVESLEQKLSRAVESQVQNLREELGSSVKSEGKSLQQGLEDLRMEVARVASQEPQLERKTNENKAELGRVNSEIVGLREELGQKLARSETEALQADFGGKFASLREEVVSANSKVKMVMDEQSSEIKSLREAVESSKVQESETQTEIARLRSFVVNNFPVDRLQTFWPTSKTIDLSSRDFSKYEKGQDWCSAPFSLGDVQGLFFRFYPKGESTSLNGHCALYLKSHCASTSVFTPRGAARSQMATAHCFCTAKGVKLDFTLTLAGTTKRLTGTLFDTDDMGWGYPSFAPVQQSYSTLKVKLLKASYV